MLLTLDYPCRRLMSDKRGKINSNEWRNNYHPFKIIDSNERLIEDQMCPWNTREQEENIFILSHIVRNDKNANREIKSENKQMSIESNENE